jgi:hypothetical protein
MAATIAGVQGGSEDVWGRHRVVIKDITGDAAYPTGGYAITGPQTGNRQILTMIPAGGVTAALGLIPYWNTTTNKLQFFYPTETGTSPNVGGEVPNGTNLSTITVRMLVISLDD